MFRDMRRTDRQATLEKAMEIMESCEYGVLATSGADSFPYALPISYVYLKAGTIYLHCAKEGQKLDNIKNNEKVSFCVVGKTEVLPDKFSTSYESAVAFGTAVIVSDQKEKEHALELIIRKYAPDYHENGLKYIRNSMDVTEVVRIEIAHMTAKERKK